MKVSPPLYVEELIFTFFLGRNVNIKHFSSVLDSGKAAFVEAKAPSSQMRRKQTASG